MYTKPLFAGMQGENRARFPDQIHVSKSQNASLHYRYRIRLKVHTSVRKTGLQTSITGGKTWLAKPCSKLLPTLSLFQLQLRYICIIIERNLR